MRISVGLEDFEDLKADLIQGLRKVVQVRFISCKRRASRLRLFFLVKTGCQRLNIWCQFEIVNPAFVSAASLPANPGLHLLLLLPLCCFFLETQLIESMTSPQSTEYVYTNPMHYSHALPDPRRPKDALPPRSSPLRRPILPPQNLRRAPPNRSSRRTPSRQIHDRRRPSSESQHVPDRFGKDLSDDFDGSTERGGDAEDGGGDAVVAWDGEGTGRGGRSFEDGTEARSGVGEGGEGVGVEMGQGEA